MCNVHCPSPPPRSRMRWARKSDNISHNHPCFHQSVKKFDGTSSPNTKKRLRVLTYSHYGTLQHIGNISECKGGCFHSSLGALRGTLIGDSCNKLGGGLYRSATQGVKKVMGNGIGGLFYDYISLEFLKFP